MVVGCAWFQSLWTVLVLQFLPCMMCSSLLMLVSLPACMAVTFEVRLMSVTALGTVPKVPVTCPV